MAKLLITLLIVSSLGLAAFAQDDETAIATTAEPATDVDEEEADTEEVDDSDLDEQTYEEDDDDFVPSEEIPLDEPIPFPTNI
jgi:hypothetical protein